MNTTTELKLLFCVASVLTWSECLAADVLNVPSLPQSSETANSPFSSLVLTCDRPVAYYAGQGKLLLDVRNFQAEPRCPSLCATYFRAYATVGDAVSRVFAPSVDGTSGTADTLGLLTQFT